MAFGTSQRGPLLRRWSAALAAGVMLVGGCSPPGSELRSAPEVAMAHIGTALHDPVWSYDDNTLVGLTDDNRLAQISYQDPGKAQTRLSEPMSVGRNVQISQKNHREVYVPQPARDKVAIVSLDTLQPVGDFDAGPAPAYLSEDGGMRVLLALSSDGSSVTPVDQYGYRKLPTVKVSGEPAEMIHGANRGREIEYHLYGPSGIRHFRGPSSPPEELGSLPMPVAVSAGDGTQVTRSYVASRNDNVLYAVDSRRGEEGMKVLGLARLSSPIRYLGTDDFRIYAATDQDLTVLETASFIGYPRGDIPVLRVINYRAGVPDGSIASSAPLSGMAVGPDRVYLTLSGQPDVISVAKPRV